MGGAALALEPRAAPVARTQVYSSLDKGADAQVQRVIAANIGRGRGAEAASPKPAVAGADAPGNAASSTH